MAPDMMTEDRKLVDSALYERRLPGGYRNAIAELRRADLHRPVGRALRTNMGQARRTTRALEGGGPGAVRLRRGPARTWHGSRCCRHGARCDWQTARCAALWAVWQSARVQRWAQGVHEALRPTRVSDLAGPKVMTNEGHVISAFTQMKSAAWQPEMLYAVLRRDGSRRLRSSDTQRNQPFTAACSAEVHDDLSPGFWAPTVSRKLHFCSSSPFPPLRNGYQPCDTHYGDP